MKKTGKTTAQIKPIYRCFLPDLTGFEKLILHSSRNGERGIRTLGTISGTHDFQSCTFDHSDISPKKWSTFSIKDSMLRTYNLYGKRGIRTPGTFTSTTVFETARFSHSRIFPIKCKNPKYKKMRLGGFELPTFRSAI